MIHDEEKQEILSNFSGEETSFAIDATSSHIFEILRDKQYSNGKESLVREIIANAKDSHAEAGKSDVPIRIWLNSNYLTIQDFGVGLSPERMDTVYRHYGKSTKRASNEQQGFYGIGAKSFFSYASSASITSVYNGIKYEYAAYINETNVGAIRLISEEPTDEVNGVAIKIPIQPQHFNEFRGYVKKYSQFMDPTPEIFGDNVYGPTEPPKVSLEGTNWKIFSDSKLNDYNVLLDGIPYKYYINSNGVHAVTFIFKTGELIPSATREALTVCDKNTNAIEAAIQVFKSEILQTIQTTIETSTDFNEVIKTIHSARQHFSLYQSEWEWTGGKFSYPYEKESLLRCRHSYGQLRKFSSSTFDSGDLQPNSLILVPDDFDFSDVKGYISRKINYHRAKHGLSVVYLVKAIHGVPDNLVTKFEDIKISYGSTGVKAPRVKNAPKTTVYVNLRGKNSRSLLTIDRSNLEDIIYTREPIGSFYSQYKSMGYINVKCVEVQEKDLKLVKGKPGWYTIQEYIEEKLTKSLTKEEIELEYKKAVAANAYNSYSYLKDYLHEDFKIGFEKTSLTNEQINLIKFIQANGELEEPQVPNLYGKYPLLKVIDKSEVGKVPGASNYQYNIKIELNDVVNYIQLINKQESENV